MTNIKLVPLNPDDREQFITDNQEAFNYGALRALINGRMVSAPTVERHLDKFIFVQLNIDTKVFV